MAETQPHGTAAPITAAPITLDQLVALNDEIAALVRAGVPLEQGLTALGGDMPGSLGKVTKAIARRMGQGESLGHVMAEHGRNFPPVYRAVVEVGLKTGRLADALEAVAGSVRRLKETRRAVATAFLYPLIVAMVAWALFVFFVRKVAPALLSTFDYFDLPGSALLGWLDHCRLSVHIWGPAVPVVVVLLSAVWWYRSSRAALVEPHWTGVLLGWLPWVGRMVRTLRTATFVEILALLVENGVPLHDAVVLAAEAAGDRRTLRAARQLADALERGESLQRLDTRRLAFPPLLSWLMATGQRHEALLPALKNAAETYHRRAQYQSDAARVFLPVLLTLVIGGGVTFVYAMMLFVPYVTMLKALGLP